MSCLALVNSALGSVRFFIEAQLRFLNPALRLLPSAMKYIGILLLLINARSFPLGWHCRVLYPVAEFLVALQFTKLRLLFSFSNRAGKKAALEAWYETRMPVGFHPLREVWTYKSWASPDDCDFLLHLNNSSYGKAMDCARFRMAIETFPNFLRCGGWAPLAATHYHFIREIPMFAPYEVRASVGAWDDKWIWVIARFVKPPSKKSKGKGKVKATSASISNEDSNSASVSTALPDIVTEIANGNASENGPKSGASPSATAQALLARAAQVPEVDGALVYTVTVAQLCYKLGRRTVPPAVILAANGFSAPLPSSSPSLSSSLHTPSPSLDADARTPPAHWAETRALRASIPALKAFYAGGWRETEQGWWREALAGCEAERRGCVVA
ncbi:hypothetical protein B0H17DRAFT_933988 [Mycena rosella]|uniref:Thioesterase n=1 Tax=Mycena rosella TaxID=1033263 RepID=A0AAD7DIK2_MYCRO|nr:hypothetical protein B0H17DRAFT_933988 [Mycena rosella]